MNANYCKGNKIKRRGMDKERGGMQWEQWRGGRWWGVWNFWFILYCNRWNWEESKGNWADLNVSSELYLNSSILIFAKDRWTKWECLGAENALKGTVTSNILCLNL